VEMLVLDLLLLLELTIYMQAISEGRRDVDEIASYNEGD